ncbi:MAG: hypothetical protein K5768_10710 [Firmicutes bacterium]|nr:hypothetical protein [Bacillota bacterium]
MKKILSLLLVGSIVLMGNFNVFAKEQENIINVQVEEYNKLEDYEWAPLAAYPVINVSENATEEEKVAAINAYLEKDPDLRAVEFSLYTIVIRSGNSTDCELYFGWTGTKIISMISFSNMKIQSTSIFSPTVYSNIGGSTIYCTPAASTGTAKILDINIPTNVTQVRAVISSPMIYSLTDGSWLSLLAINSIVTIH